MTAQEMGREVAEMACASRFALRSGFTPDDWQAQLLDSQARNIIVCCSRQVGKSTTVGVKTGHVGSTTPGGLILLTAPTERQSKELLIKAKDSIRVAGVEVIKDGTTEVIFSNGCRLFALPGSEKTIRGYSAVDLLIIDEAAWVPDALYYSVEPMMAVPQGQTVLLSTPFGKRGFFYETWENGGDFWERYRVTAYDCPRIPADWLERKRESMPDYWFRQEYLATFMDSEDAVFRTEDLMRALSDDVDPLFGSDDELADIAAL